MSDLSALAGLTELVVLNLQNNQVTDIRPLARMTKLSILWLGQNQIKDVSVLAKLTELSALRLGQNAITRIDALSGLSKLTCLDLSSNRISSLSGLPKMLVGSSACWPMGSGDCRSEVSVAQNQIKDLAPLLKEGLLSAGIAVDVAGNPLDLSPGSPILDEINTLAQRGVTVCH